MKDSTKRGLQMAATMAPGAVFLGVETYLSLISWADIPVLGPYLPVLGGLLLAGILEAQLYRLGQNMSNNLLPGMDKFYSTAGYVMFAITFILYGTTVIVQLTTEYGHIMTGVLVFVLSAITNLTNSLTEASNGLADAIRAKQNKIVEIAEAETPEQQLARLESELVEARYAKKIGKIKGVQSNPVQKSVQIPTQSNPEKLDSEPIPVSNPVQISRVETSNPESNPIPTVVQPAGSGMESGKKLGKSDVFWNKVLENGWTSFTITDVMSLENCGRSTAYSRLVPHTTSGRLERIAPDHYQVKQGEQK